MSDLQSTLDAIDDVAVHHCGWCDEPLRPNALSRYFCGPGCQEYWNERQGEKLIGYREPEDLAAHVFNLEELSSPEVTPSRTILMDAIQLRMRERLGSLAAPPALRRISAPGEWRPRGLVQGAVRQGAGPGYTIIDETHVIPGDQIEYTLEFDTTPLLAGMAELGAQLRQVAISFDPAPFRERLQRLMCGISAAREPEPETATAMQAALEARRNRNTGPAQQQRAPRRINPRRTR